jgi:hypothetical protein
MASKDGTAILDAAVLRVLKSVHLADVAIIRDEEVEGYFVEQVQLAGIGDGQVAAGETYFDCRQEELPTAPLEENEEIEVEGYGPFRYLRSVPDSSGRVLLILGAFL